MEGYHEAAPEVRVVAGVARVTGSWEYYFLVDENVDYLCLGGGGGGPVEEGSSW